LRKREIRRESIDVLSP
jgi:hypothetical protein